MGSQYPRRYGEEMAEDFLGSVDNYSAAVVAGYVVWAILSGC
jgi:hypothetical protein